MNLDCSFGRALHHLEAAARIITEAISGVVVGLAIRSELVLSVLSARGSPANRYVHRRHRGRLGRASSLNVFAQVTTGAVENAVSGEAAKD